MIELSDEQKLLAKAILEKKSPMEAFRDTELPASAMLFVDLTIAHWNLSRDRLERFVSPDPLPIDVLPMKDREDAV